MRTVSAKIPDELFNAVQELAEQKNTNLNKLIAQGLQGIIQGKIEMKSLGGKDICPRCGHTLHIIQEPVDHGAKIWFVCLNCDWAGFLGRFVLPKQIDDLTKKFNKET